MGRGLSPLQRSILAMAYANREEAMAAPDDPEREAIRHRFGFHGRTLDDLHSFEVMLAVFGCVERPTRYPPERTPAGRRVDRWGHQRISQTLTGRAKYDAAAVSTHRAFRRLERRGLVERRWFGAVTLTEEGCRVARELSANARDTCPNLEPIGPDAAIG